MKMDLGKSEDAGIYEGGDGFGAEKSRARPNRLLLRARLLPARDPSAPSPIGDEAVQRSRVVCSASEHGTGPSSREATTRPSLG